VNDARAPTPNAFDVPIKTTVFAVFDALRRRKAATSTLGVEQPPLRRRRTKWMYLTTTLSQRL